MSDVLLTLLWVAAAALLLFVLTASAITWTAIRRLRLLPPESHPLAAAPPEALALLAPGLAHLEAMGFAAPQALRLVALSSAGQPLPQHVLVLSHAECGAAAYLVQQPVSDHGRGFSLHFVSRTVDGRTLVTRNRASVAGPLDLPDTITQDLWLPTWAAVWQAHRERMRALQPDSGAWLHWPAEAWIPVGAAAERQAFERRVQRGDFQPVADGSYRISGRAALAMLARAWAVFWPSQRGMTDDAIGDAAQTVLINPVETFEREHQAARSSQRSMRAKWLLFLATAAAAALSFGFSLSWEALPTLLGVLLFHELGHLAAMRLSGYRDLQVFFLPFMGAAVSGRPERPTMGKELFVLLAGPVPGLLLGLAALLWPPIDAPWLHRTAWFAVMLNVINLLPFHPLDGGRVFELLLLSRWPRAALAGRALGLLALAAWVLSGDGGIGQFVFLGALLLMSLGLWQQARQARLVSHLRAHGQWGGLARDEALRALFQGVQTLGYGQRPWAEQKLMVEALLPLAQQPRLRWRARVAGLLLYAFCLGLPLLTATLHGLPARAPARAAPVGAVDPARQLDARNAELEALRTRLAALQDPAAQWQLLEQEMDAVSEELAEQPAGRLPAAEALLRDAAPLAARLPDALARQVQLTLWQAQAQPRQVERLALLQAAVARYGAPEAKASDPGPLFRAAVLWLDTAPELSPERRQALLDQALARGAGLATGADAAALRRHHLDDLHARGEGVAVFEQLHAWQAAAPGDLQLREDLAQLELDATVAAGGAAAGLDLLDRVLPALQVLGGPDSRPGTGLRRQGLWLAESADRPDWQRAQAPLLPEARTAKREISWSRRFLLWIGGNAPRTSLREVEQAHWRGDFTAAQAAARRWQAQRGPHGMQLPDLSDASGLAARRLQLVQQGRRALYERYGLR